MVVSPVFGSVFVRVLSVCVAVAGLFSFARGAMVAEEVLPGLAPLIQDALHQSPRMIQQNLERLRAEHQTLVSSAALYPRVGGSLTYNLQREDRGGDWGNGQRLLYNVSANYPLFHWGAITAAADIGKISAAMANHNHREAYRLLAVQIRSDYLQLIIGKANLRTALFALELQKQNFELTKARLDAGELPGIAMAGAKLTLDEGSLAADRTQQSFAAAVNRFRRLVGSTTFDADNIPEEIPQLTILPHEDVAPFHRAFLDAAGWEKSVSYLNSELRVAQQKLSERIIRVNQRPKFDLNVGVSQDELTFAVDVTNRSRLTAAYVGVGVSWNIFDGFATRGNLRSTRTTLRQLENSLVELQEDLQEGAAAALTEVGFAGRALDIAEQGYAGALDGLDQAKENFELGLISEAALRSAEASEFGARSSIYSSRAAYLNAIAAFLSSVNADPLVASEVNPPTGS